MNVSDALVRALHGQKELERQYHLGFATAVPGGPYEAEVCVDGVTVGVRAIDTGRYGLRLCRLRLCADGGVNGAGDGFLDAIADSVVTPYGPFVAANDTASLLRTHAVGEAACYYEAAVGDRGEVVVTHHAVAPATGEVQTAPVDIGLDMFRIMVTDLVEAMRRTLSRPV